MEVMAQQAVTMMINPAKRVRLMIIDDSSSVRAVFGRMLADRDDIQIVGSFGDAVEAIAKIPTVRPDVISLDVEMPGLSGMDALQQILEIDPEAKVIMLSALTLAGSKTTTEALSLGAVDVLTKPGLGVSPSEFKTAFCNKLISLRRH
jgi:two-component system, chemotaxis family, protein-glutamate methylesterase/glutaminase